MTIFGGASGCDTASISSRVTSGIAIATITASADDTSAHDAA
jgi:hypothetical protein